MNDGEAPKIQSFRDLDAWKEGHKLALLTYKTTEGFPKMLEQSTKAHKLISGLIKKSKQIHRDP